MKPIALDPTPMWGGDPATEAGELAAAIAALEAYADAAVATHVAASASHTSLTTLAHIGTLVSGAVPFSLLTPGTAGAGDYVFPSDLTVTDTLVVGTGGSVAHSIKVGIPPTASGTPVLGVYGAAGLSVAEFTQPDSGTVSFQEWYQPDTTDGNAGRLRYLTDTTGVGATTRRAPVVLRMVAPVHNDATRRGDFIIDLSNSAAATQMFRVFGGRGVRVGATTTLPNQIGYYGSTDNAEDIYESGTRARTIYGYTGNFATGVVVGTDNGALGILRVGTNIPEAASFGGAIRVASTFTPTGITYGDAAFYLGSTITVRSGAGVVRSVLFNNTLIAAANNDVLYGMQVQDSFTPGAFTGLVARRLRLNAYSVAGFTSPGDPISFEVGQVTGTGATNAYAIKLGDGPTGATNNYLLHATNFTVTSGGIGTFTEVLAPTLDSGSATDLVLQRNNVTKLTLGNTTDTFANNTITNGNADWVFQRNASTIFTLAAASLTMNLPVLLKVYTVATLPAGTKGFVAAVSDASAVTAKGATVAGGGAAYAVLTYDGTNWVGI